MIVVADDREMGRMAAEIENLQRTVEKLTATVEQLTQYMAEIRAGKSYLLMMLTFAATVGALVDRLISWWK